MVIKLLVIVLGIVQLDGTHTMRIIYVFLSAPLLTLAIILPGLALGSALSHRIYLARLTTTHVYLYVLKGLMLLNKTRHASLDALIVQ